MIPLFAPVWNPHPRQGNKSPNESDAWPKMAERRRKQDNCHRVDTSARRYQRRHPCVRPSETKDAQTGTQRSRHLYAHPTPHPRRCDPRLERQLAKHHRQRAQRLGEPIPPDMTLVCPLSPDTTWRAEHPTVVLIWFTPIIYPGEVPSNIILWTINLYIHPRYRQLRERASKRQIFSKTHAWPVGLQVITVLMWLDLQVRHCADTT